MLLARLQDTINRTMAIGAIRGKSGFKCDARVGHVSATLTRRGSCKKVPRIALQRGLVGVQMHAHQAIARTQFNGWSRSTARFGIEQKTMVITLGVPHLLVLQPVVAYGSQFAKIERAACHLA
jgi:hypothetical protein